MLNQRIAATRMVAEKLNATENAIDDALISASELTATFPVARREANVSPVVGQQAIALVGEAAAALQKARAKLVAAHFALAEVRDELRIPVKADGGLWKLAEAPPSVTLIGQQNAA